MKRIKSSIHLCLLTFLLCCNICSIYAQTDDEFCGDWVGTYTERLPDNNNEWRDMQIKMYIRINKMNSNYTVRIKTQCPGSDMSYWPTCEHISRQGNSLNFIMDRGNNYDWDANDKFMGKRINSSHYVIHGSLSAGTGSIYYKDYMITTYYGGGNKIGEEKSPIKGGYLREVTLYKDDGW